jgi:hypothetical protein
MRPAKEILNPRNAAVAHSMSTRLKLTLVGGATVFALTGFTLLALEGNEVAILYTTSAAGERRTRVWVADHDGAPWIEAASPERGFYRDILIDPRVELKRNGERISYQALAFPGEQGHSLIRALLRRKYGWADIWVGMIADTSSSIAVRLEPH